MDAALRQELQTTLQEYRDSLKDVEAVLESGDEESTARKLKEDLLDSIRQTEESLGALKSPQRPDLPCEGVDNADSQNRTGGALIANNPFREEGFLPAHAEVKSQRNPRIHPRNLYAVQEPDFAALAAHDDRLRPHVVLHANGRGSIDFTNPSACRELTRSLLKQDYGIDWWVADGQLIPAVTNRVNYIHWLQDLLQLSAPLGELVGMDIGCGANLIYCLLAAQIGGWKMIGVDITLEAKAGAENNLSKNSHLQPLIELRIQERQPGNIEKGVLVPAMEGSERLAFTMCNPPFFASLAEAGQNPATAFQGTAAEMVFPGGELAFVVQMVHDSLALRERVHWFSSMVGKKSTLKAVRQALHSHNIAALRVTEFAQGRTSRWGIAWSFSEAAKRSEAVPLARGLKSAPKAAKRQTIFSLQASKAPAQTILERLRNQLEAAGGRCTLNMGAFSLIADMPMKEGARDSSNASQMAKRHKAEQPSSGSFSILASVMAERPGVLAVKAKIVQQSTEAVARQFTDIMLEAEQNLQQLL